MDHGVRDTGLCDPARDGAKLASVHDGHAFVAQKFATGRRRAASNRLPTYAALDLGTNNCRLLVARPAGDGFRVVDAFSRIIRLGEGVTSSRRISEAAIGRAIAALTICRNKMKNKGVTRARLIATEACRAAENGEDFRARVAQDVG